MKKKKTTLLLAMLSAALVFGCGKKEAADTGSADAVQSEKPADEEPSQEMEAGLANPWSECDEDTILQTLGFEMKAPENSSNIRYQINETNGIGQMVFTYGEPALEYTYRMKSVASFEDISGLNYNWDIEEDILVQWCEGKFKRVREASGTTDVCLWCDMAPGFMYSLSTSAEDLDGFDLTAVADMIFEPMQGDAGPTGFVPSNFMEAKIQKDVFDSFDEVISLLEKGNAYAIVKVYGYDKDVLFIAEGAYDNGDGNMAAIEGGVYIEDNGVVKSVGNVYSSGTAYPISLDSEGKIFSGGNHEVNVSCLSKEYKSIMEMEYAYESFDENQNVTYGGFVRESNTLEDNGTDIAEDDGSVLAGLYTRYEAASPISYTVK